MTQSSTPRRGPHLVPTPRMISAPLPQWWLRALGGLGMPAFGLAAAPPSAFAQGRLEAHYEATLAGIPVGRGAWNIDISDDQFSAAAAGVTSGLLRALAGGW